MLTPRVNNCPQCADIISLISDIDCRIFELGLDLYNNTVFMLGRSINKEVISDLLHYKRILIYKLCNPNYAGKYTVNMIASRVKILSYK